MKKTQLFLATVTATLLLASCSSNDPVVTGNENSNSQENTYLQREQNDFTVLEDEANRHLKQFFHFDAGTEHVTLTSKRGATIDLDPGKLRLNGHPVTGQVDVEFVEIYSRGNMITAGKSTEAISYEPTDGPSSFNADEANNPDAPRTVLTSGGEFYVKMSQEGQDLDDGTPYTISVPTDNTGEPQDDMKGWKGEEQDNGDVLWDKNTDSDGNQNDTPVVDGKYIMEMLNWGWCNVDKLRNDPDPKTMLYVQVPSGYDNHNCKVYYAFQGDQNSIAPLDLFNPSNNEFNPHDGYVTVGSQGYIIFVSGSGGNWEYAVKAITIVANGVIVINSSDISTATEAGLISMFNSLP